MTNSALGMWMDRARKKAAQHESDRRMKIALDAYGLSKARVEAYDRVVEAAEAAGEHEMALQYRRERQIARATQAQSLHTALARSVSRQRI